MPDLIDGTENVSVQGILNWILLLAIFSVITVIGNYVGYKHPIQDSLIGMGILSLITLLGVWMERELSVEHLFHYLHKCNGNYFSISWNAYSRTCFILCFKN